MSQGSRWAARHSVAEPEKAKGAGRLTNGERTHSDLSMVALGGSSLELRCATAGATTAAESACCQLRTCLPPAPDAAQALGRTPKRHWRT
jgi:hypothetical protein